MDPHYFATGVIVKASKDSSIVSINIDDVGKLFKFSKHSFYTFGMKCEGDMTNILEDGMEVDVMYKMSNNNLFIAAVWLGDRPDCLCNSMSQSLYNKKGQVVRVYNTDEYLVQSENGNVLINKDVVYRDGYRANYLNINDFVLFDAIPFKISHPSGALYQATCAWIGQDPRLVDRFVLDNNEVSWEREDNGGSLVTVETYGTISVIANDVVAFVDVDVSFVEGKVILFRGSLGEGCDRIQDAVHVGQSLCLILRVGYIFRGCRQWFVTKAWKDGVEVCPEKEFLKETQSRKDEGAILNEKMSMRKRSKADDVEVLPEEEKLQENAQESEEDRAGIKARAEAIANLLEELESIDVDKYKDFIEGSALEKVEKELGDYKKLQVQLNFLLEDTQRRYGAGAVLGDCRKAQGLLRWILAEGERRLKENEYVSGDTGSHIPKVLPERTVVKFDKDSEVLFNDPPLTGVISSLSLDSATASIEFQGLKVLVKRDDIYINRSLCSDEQFSKLVSTGEAEVNFEAIKTNCSDCYQVEAGITHDATCVWVGERPSLSIICDSLPKPNFDLLKQKDRVLYGRIMKYCLPKVALIEVESENTTASLHVSSFGCKPKNLVKYVSGKDCITQFVKLDDCVEFKVTRFPQCPKILSAVSVKKITKAELERNLLKKHTTSRHDAQYSKEEKKSETFNLIAGYKSVPFSWSPPCLDRTWLLGGHGKLEKAKSLMASFFRKSLQLKPNFGMDVDIDCNFHERAILCIDALIGKSGTTIFPEVRFDGELKNGKLLVTRLWDSEPTSARLSSAELLTSNSKVEKTAVISTIKPYRGKISSIPYNDCAIAVINDVSVLISYGSLVTDERVNISTSSIDIFLKEGDEVGLMIEKRAEPFHLAATKCWKLEKLTEGEIRDDLTQEFESPDLSWFKKWGYREYYQQDTIKKSGVERYLVNYKTGGHTIKLNLDEVIKKRRFFFEGNRLESDVSLSDHIEVKFFVAQECKESLRNNIRVHGTFAYIACAWIGRKPSASRVLEDELIVPEGVIRDTKGGVVSHYYNAVVADFPLPTHAVCRIGVLPVLVKVGVSKDGVCIPDDDICLKKGGRMLIRVEKIQMETGVILRAKDPSESKAYNLWSNVFRNIPGVVERLPRPTGVIKTKIGASEIGVSFELCHIWPEANRFMNKAERFAWFKYLNESIEVGTKVFCTLGKFVEKSEKFYIEEVWIRKEM